MIIGKFDKKIFTMEMGEWKLVNSGPFFKLGNYFSILYFGVRTAEITTKTRLFFEKKERWGYF